MVDETLFSSLEKPLSQAQEILIFLPSEPNYDRQAAALSLFLSLKAAGKKPAVLCATPAKVEASDLVGIDKIKNAAAGRNLVVTFDYLEDSIEKVSYHIEDQKFKLVIKPKPGFEPLDSQKVDFSYPGADADLVFLVGVRSLSEIRDLVDQPEEVVLPAKTVLIDTRPANSLSDFPLVWPAASYSEIAAYFINQLRLPVDVDIADNLYKGLQTATRTFSSPQVTATTFEAAAFCLRAGAKAKGQKTSRETRVLPRTDSPKDSLRPAARSGKDTAGSKKKASSGSDWLEPKIYTANTRI